MRFLRVKRSTVHENDVIVRLVFTITLKNGTVRVRFLQISVLGKSYHNSLIKRVTLINWNNGTQLGIPEDVNVVRI